MKRRQFIQITAAGTLAAALPGATWPQEDRSALQVLADPGLLALLGSMEAIHRIGRAFRDQFRHEYGVSALRKVLFADVGLSFTMSEGQIRDRLDQQIRGDFERGRTVRLDGWILSKTEARQTVLYSILNS